MIVALIEIHIAVLVLLPELVGLHLPEIGVNDRVGVGYPLAGMPQSDKEAGE